MSKPINPKFLGENGIEQFPRGKIVLPCHTFQVLSLVRIRRISYNS